MACSRGTVQILKGNSQDFSQEDPFLKAGELAYTIDTETLKIGTGLNSWQFLPEVVAGACVEPCVKTFRLNGTIASLDTQIDVVSGDPCGLTFQGSMSNGQSVFYPDALYNNQYVATATVNDVVVASGLGFDNGVINQTGRLFVQVNHPDNSNNEGYFLVRYTASGCL